MTPQTSKRVWGAGTGLLLVALVGLVNYLAFRHYDRWDFTTARLFTLSTRTEEVLTRLDREVDVYVFLSRFDPMQRNVDELLERYKSRARKLTVRFVDPNTEPDEFRVLAQRFGVLSGEFEGNVVADLAAVVVSGEKRWKITNDDLASVDFDSVEVDDSGASADQLVKMEQAFTGAILQVVRGRPTKICATKGHGEWGVDAGGERSLMTLKDELERDNIVFESVDLIGAAAIPEGCDALFVIGPTNAFSERETATIQAFLAAGHGVLMTLDPVLEREAFQPLALESILGPVGITAGADVVIEINDARRLDGELLGKFLVNDYGDHATTRAFTRLSAPTVVRFPRSIRTTEGGDAKSILRTSAESWAETSVAQLGGLEPPSLDPDDGRGPVSIGAAAEVDGRAGGRKGRLVVVGTSQWLAPAWLMQPQLVNFELASAWIGWLTERDELVSIPPRRVSREPVTMTADDVFWLFFRLVVFMPAAALFIGLAMWRSRRN
jgi:hypothetical protein